MVTTRQCVSTLKTGSSSFTRIDRVRAPERANQADDVGANAFRAASTPTGSSFTRFTISAALSCRIATSHIPMPQGEGPASTL